MSKPYPQAREVIPWTNEKGIQCVRLGVAGMGEQVRIQQNGQSGVRVNVSMIDALCEALQAAKEKVEQERAQVAQLQMRQLQEKARTWITSHGTTIYDDRDEQIADVMEELELTDERDADAILTLVKDHAQVFIEFDMSELAAAE